MHDYQIKDIILNKETKELYRTTIDMSAHDNGFILASAARIRGIPKLSRKIKAIHFHQQNLGGIVYPNMSDYRWLNV